MSLLSRIGSFFSPSPKQRAVVLNSAASKVAPRGFMQHYKDIQNFKKGGRVKKTGLAKVHKGERVLNAKQAKKFEKVKKQVFGIKSYGKNKSK